MSYVYCAYLSFCGAVAPMGAAAHHVGEVCFLLKSIGRVCAFVVTMIAVTVGPAVLRGAQDQLLGTSTAHTALASANKANAMMESHMQTLLAQVQAIQLANNPNYGSN